MRLLTIAEVMGRLSVSRSTIAGLIRHGRINVVRIGRAVRISEAEADRLATHGVAGRVAEPEGAQ